jgi:hypothetical protein
MSQSQIEAYTRRAGAAVALAAASALTTGFPALEPRAHVVLALHAILLLGCAAVLLSPAHGDGGPEAGIAAVARLRRDGAQRAPRGRGGGAAGHGQRSPPLPRVLGRSLGSLPVHGQGKGGRGAPAPQPRLAVEEDANGEEANAMPMTGDARVVVDSKV